MRLDPGAPGARPQGRRRDAVRGLPAVPVPPSSQKNQTRFQFGVLMPPAYRAVDDCEPSASQTECLLECPDEAEILVVVRFLQLQRRTVQADRRTPAPCTRSARCTWTAPSTPPGTRPRSGSSTSPRRVGQPAAGGQEHRVPRRRRRAAEDITDSRGPGRGPLDPALGRDRRDDQAAAPNGSPGPTGAAAAGPGREPHHPGRGAAHQGRRPALRPDRGARADRGARRDVPVHDRPAGVGRGRGRRPAPTPAPGRCWPGPEDCRDLLLSSPVILYDHPEVAAESAGDLFDATEIDEILTLRTMALTDAEKREARATDPRAAELMDRLDDMPAGDAGAHARGDPLPAAGAGSPPGPPAAGMPPTPDGMTAGLPGWPPDDIPTWSTPGC